MERNKEEVFQVYHKTWSGCMINISTHLSSQIAERKLFNVMKSAAWKLNCAAERPACNSTSRGGWWSSTLRWTEWRLWRILVKTRSRIRLFWLRWTFNRVVEQEFIKAEGAAYEGAYYSLKKTRRPGGLSYSMNGRLKSPQRIKYRSRYVPMYLFEKRSWAWTNQLHIRYYGRVWRSNKNIKGIIGPAV